MCHPGSAGPEEMGTPAVAGGVRRSLSKEWGSLLNQVSVRRPVALNDVKIAWHELEEQLLILKGAPGTGSLLQ